MNGWIAFLSHPGCSQLVGISTLMLSQLDSGLTASPPPAPGADSAHRLTGRQGQPHPGTGLDDYKPKPNNNPRELAGIKMMPLRQACFILKAHPAGAEVLSGTTKLLLATRRTKKATGTHA